ncbi:MAG: TetR/AcrR family transcriptional regulator [Pleurocapsa sp. SU_196_0]|nr:TetR/AcrR family transcriptional regulator [Pleurocapsa sp. SU_196_0]
MKRSKQDWIHTGLELLRIHGEQALTIERLCQTLEISKGSFYHHFGDLERYQTTLVEFWEQTFTQQPIETAWQYQHPAQRAVVLGETVRQLDHQLDLAFRAWGLHDPIIKAAVNRVDTRRLEALTGLHHIQGHPHPEQLAQLEYAAFIGAQHLGFIPQYAQIEQMLMRSLSLLVQDLNRPSNQGA